MLGTHKLQVGIAYSQLAVPGAVISWVRLCEKAELFAKESKSQHCSLLPLSGLHFHHLENESSACLPGWLWVLSASMCLCRMHVFTCSTDEWKGNSCPGGAKKRELWTNIERGFQKQVLGSCNWNSLSGAYGGVYRWPQMTVPYLQGSPWIACDPIRCC